MASISKPVLGAVVLVAAIGSYWHFSPYLALHSIQSAAKEGDADAFNERVDYPALRESLKGQMTAIVMPKMEAEVKGNPFAALGSTLALAMVNQMVESFVRPEVVMRLMAEGKLARSKAHASQDRPEPAGNESRTGEKANWNLKRVSSDRVIFYQREEEAATGGQAGVVFNRHGFASWKLSEIRIPNPDRQQ